VVPTSEYGDVETKEAGLLGFPRTANGPLPSNPSRYPQSRVALRELLKGLPFLDIAVVRGPAFDEYVHRVFAGDRIGLPKGMIEVIEWTSETSES
jgi:hypothetical protein